MARAIRIDRILKDHDLDKVDYLKMDIEGAEATVLDGPLDWARRIMSIKVEVHPPATIDRCSRALTLAGFQCERDLVHAQCVSGRRLV